MNIDETVSRIIGKERTGRIVREAFREYDIDGALGTVEAIGKAKESRFCIDDRNRFVYCNLVRWLHADERMKAIHPVTGREIAGRLDCGIYLGGSTGTGKSLAIGVMADYGRLCGFRMWFGCDDGAATWRVIRSDAICDVYAESGTVRKYGDAQILCVDDFGTEPEVSSYMGNRVDVMRQLVESRGDRRDRISIVVSNLPLCGGVKARYGDRVQSRLYGMCNYFKLEGKDRRLP
ncbi:MAG: hypothetical protein LBL04_04810 [Bacteroidales bacterium]|jgi:hypothetical protein|nr:hypothetical protein [Bacteroidales bacterium]